MRRCFHHLHPSRSQLPASGMRVVFIVSRPTGARRPPKQEVSIRKPPNLECPAKPATDPGADHIDFHRGEPSPGKTDPIVNPTTLSNRLSSQVCGACHGFTAALSFEEYQYDLLDGYRFRPGADISKTRLIEGLNEETRAHVVRSGGEQEIYFRERFWDDGMVRLLGREYNAMMDSPVIRGSRAG